MRQGIGRNASTTSSYAEIASRIGAPNGARAVAEACDANPLAVAIPCHRVVRTDGSLSGYKWGVQRKKRVRQQPPHQPDVPKGDPTWTEDGDSSNSSTGHG
jgi:AraC family transcriptional regulator of adaptative response/methylated-DNA-[protein]-cysteine methyltransferase